MTGTEGGVGRGKKVGGGRSRAGVVGALYLRGREGLRGGLRAIISAARRCLDARGSRPFDAQQPLLKGRWSLSYSICKCSSAICADVAIHYATNTDVRDSAHGSFLPGAPAP